jgi:hypothetical protein
VRRTIALATSEEMTIISEPVEGYRQYRRPWPQLRRVAHVHVACNALHGVAADAMLRGKLQHAHESLRTLSSVVVQSNLIAIWALNFPSSAALTVVVGSSRYGVANGTQTGHREPHFGTSVNLVQLFVSVQTNASRDASSPLVFGGGDALCVGEGPWVLNIDREMLGRLRRRCHQRYSVRRMEAVPHILRHDHHHAGAQRV